MMDAIEKRARELLAAEIEKIEGYKLAAQIRAGSQLGPIMAVCHAAIIAALTPPEGYVLVPVEPTETMLSAGLNAPFRGHPETGGPSLPDMWAAMIAARPEMPNVND